MKSLLYFLTAYLLVMSGFSATESWTNKEGKVAQLELIKTVEIAKEIAGKFKMTNGKIIVLKVSELNEVSGEKLTVAAKEVSDLPKVKEATKFTIAPLSVFDSILEGNLVRLKGKSFKKCDDATKPTKYYLFYYTASWCKPCQKFTPELVEFYNKLKPNNNDFELILVTSDDDGGAMEKYAKEKGMPWPQLKLSKVDKFKKQFNHPNKGIPNLVLTDLKGEVIKKSCEGSTYLEPGVVMTHLETLLKK
jgi:thiol-disulfide isomerase/thioredoxin